MKICKVPKEQQVPVMELFALSAPIFFRDRQWFFDAMNDQLGTYYEQTLHSLCPNREIPVFGHFMSQYGNYEDINDKLALRTFMEVQMEEYNASPGVIRIDLVLFQDAIVHICKIVRVISQPRGNMLLIGIGKLVFSRLLRHRYLWKMHFPEDINHNMRT